MKRPPPPVVNCQTIVIHVYRITATDKWYCTVAKDAVQIGKTDEFGTKDEAVKACKELLI